MSDQKRNEEFDKFLEWKPLDEYDYLDEPAYTADEVKQELREKEASFCFYGYRNAIRDPELMDKTSTKEGSLGWHLAKTKIWFEEARKIDPACLSPETLEYQRKLKAGLIKDETQSELDALVERGAHEIFSKMIPGVFWDDPSKEEIFRRVLLFLIKRARDHWVQEKNLADSWDLDYFYLNRYLMMLSMRAYPDIFWGVFCETETSRKESENPNLPFNWNGFIEVFDSIPYPEAFAVYYVETQPEIWLRRSRNAVRTRLLEQLSGEKAYIEIESRPVTISQEQAAYLKVLIEAEGPMHYLEIWTAATGEIIGNEKYDDRNKAQPGNVFKSKSEVSERFIEKAGKKNSGLYIFKW